MTGKVEDNLRKAAMKFAHTGRDCASYHTHMYSPSSALIQ